MEEEEVGMIIFRASELKNKFADCIRARSGAIDVDNHTRSGEGRDESEEEEEEEASEEESLVNIRDALDGLEQLLSAFQALLQQQSYQRESSLIQIDHSRKMLLNKLKEYKGDNLEVIHEALTFACGTVNHEDDVPLPPYPSHLPDLFVMNDLDSSSFVTLKYKVAQTGNGVTREDKEGSINESNGNKLISQSPRRNKPPGIRLFFGLVAKSVLTFVGVASVLSLAGLKPAFRRNGVEFKMQELFQRPAGGGKGQALVECPLGKELVMEEGRLRCRVKERVEVPFDLDVTAPKINYGFG